MVARDRPQMEMFLELVERHPDRHFEFTAEGEVVEVSPSLIHGIIQSLISYHLNHYFQTHPMPGYKAASEVAHDLDGWPCRPDVSIDRYSEEEIPTAAPLLAVEIKSKSNSLRDQRVKAQRYIEHGTRMVWLVFPEKRVVEVYQPEADDQILLGDNILHGGDVLPGFQVAVDALFPEQE